MHTMTTGTTTAQAFTLDEAKAGEWLAAAVAAYRWEVDGEGDEPALRADNEQLPAIGADWNPREFDEEDTVFFLLRLAVDGGIITAPEGLDLDFEYVADGDGGYYYFLIRVTYDLKLATYSEEMRKLGNRNASGAAAAMAILREGVEKANRTLRTLDAYVAGRK